MSSSSMPPTWKLRARFGPGCSVGTSSETRTFTASSLHRASGRSASNSPRTTSPPSGRTGLPSRYISTSTSKPRSRPTKGRLGLEPDCFRQATSTPKKAIRCTRTRRVTRSASAGGTRQERRLRRSSLIGCTRRPPTDRSPGSAPQGRHAVQRTLAQTGCARTSRRAGVWPDPGARRLGDLAFVPSSPGWRARVALRRPPTGTSSTPRRSARRRSEDLPMPPVCWRRARRGSPSGE
jgi:hypothetical protein